MFDPSAPHIIILLVVVLLLFGAKRMPGAAKSLGESMHIFKKSIHGEDENGQPANQAGPVTTTSAAPVPPAMLPVAPVQPTFTQSYDAVIHQQQVADLQRQVADLQRQNASPQGSSVPSAPAPEAQPSQQPF